MKNQLIESVDGITHKPIETVPAKFVSVCNRHDLFAHGAALAFHRGRFFATFGRNEGMENSLGEHTVCFVSENGETWRSHSVIGRAHEQVGRSHGILFEDDGRLWAYNAMFRDTVQIGKPNTGGLLFPGLSTAAFYLDDERDEWIEAGKIADDFWPLNQPEPIGDGQYLIPGANSRFLSAYLIGSVKTGWTKFDTPVNGMAYSETACLVNENTVRLIMRNSRRDIPAEEPRYLACGCSCDGGINWTVGETSLFDNDSKPAAIRLSNGVQCIIGNRMIMPDAPRGALMILYTAPHSHVFSELRMIRDRHVPDELASLYEPQREQAAICYPYCLEHEKKLYIIYSSSGTDGVPNHNRIEMAIIHLDDLNL